MSKKFARNVVFVAALAVASMPAFAASDPIAPTPIQPHAMAADPIAPTPIQPHLLKLVMSVLNIM